MADTDSPLQAANLPTLSPAEARTFRVAQQLTVAGVFWNINLLQNKIGSGQVARQVKRLIQLGYIKNIGYKTTAEGEPRIVYGPKGGRPKKEHLHADPDDLNPPAQLLITTMLRLEINKIRWSDPKALIRETGLTEAKMGLAVQRLVYFALVRRNDLNKYRLTRTGIDMAHQLKEQDDDGKLRTQDGSSGSAASDEISRTGGELSGGSEPPRLFPEG